MIIETATITDSKGRKNDLSKVRSSMGNTRYGQKSVSVFVSHGGGSVYATNKKNRFYAGSTPCLYNLVSTRTRATDRGGVQSVIYGVDFDIRENAMNSNKKKVLSFKSLPTNWNLHGASPVSEMVVNKACQLLLLLGVYQPQVFPTARNTVQFEYETDKGYLEFEISEDSIQYFKELGELEEEGSVESMDEVKNLVHQFYA